MTSRPHLWGGAVTFIAQRTRLIRDVVPYGRPRLHVQGPPPTWQYLLPHERQILTVRKHPATLLLGPPGILCAALTAAGLVTAGTVHAGNAALGITWAACAVLLPYALVSAAAWPVTFLTVTDKRMILVRGIKVRKVATLPLADITDLTFQRSLPGRMLGYGTFIVKPAGPNRGLRKMRYLPYPEQLYLEVCALLVPRDPD